MKKIIIFSRLMFIATLIASPAVIMPMEPNLENPQDNAMQIEESCSVCLSDGPSTDFRQLRCGHRFCVECLKDLLRLGLDEEWAHAMAARLRCPKQGCNYQMNEDDVQTISGDATRVARYFEILTHLFINTNRNFRRCPMANCEVVYELGPNAQTIMCLGDCRAQYCSHCRQPHRQGEPCQQASAPIQNNNARTNANLTADQEQEQQQQEWLRQNTKQCPQCRVNIQKNDGCNHMTCTSCRHEFCWQCLAHWRGLQDSRYNEFAQTHRGFYTCNAGGIQQQAPAANRAEQNAHAGINELCQILIDNAHGAAHAEGNPAAPDYFPPAFYVNPNAAIDPLIERLERQQAQPQQNDAWLRPQLPLLGGFFMRDRNVWGPQAQPQPAPQANQDLEPQLVRRAREDREAICQLLIHHGANIDQQNHGEARIPLLIEAPAGYMPEGVAQAHRRPVAPEIAAQDHRAIRPQLAPDAEENFTITEPGRYRLEEPLPRMPFAPFMPNHDAQGPQAQPQPAPRDNQALPARLIEEVSADDDLDDLPILIDGQNWRALMNSFAANEAAQREQNRK